MSFSRVIDGVRIVVIAPERAGTCELCGTNAETRPYGPSGERICYSCAMKNPEMTEKRMQQYLTGTGLDS